MDKKPVKVINNMSGMSVAGAESMERDITWPIVMNNLMNTECMGNLFRSYMQKLMDDGRMLRFSEDQEDGYPLISQGSSRRRIMGTVCPVLAGQMRRKKRH